MSELVKAATVPERTIEMVTLEIQTLNRQAGIIMLSYAVEIGRRLTEAKSLVRHGDWGEYLREKVNFSPSTANNFMRIFEEYGDRQVSLFDDGSNSQTFGNLSYTKALALLAIPEAERAEFAQAHDVEEMSTRQLQEAIRERDEARKAEEVAIAEQKNAEAARKKMEKDVAFANERVSVLQRELEELRSRPVEVAVERATDPAELKKAREEGRLAAEKELSDKLEKAQKAAESAKKRLAVVQSGKTAQEVSAKAAEQRAVDAEAEAERLKKELKASGNQDVALFGVRFQDVQKDFHTMIEALGRVGTSGDAGQHDKLVDALRALMAALEQSIPEKLGAADKEKSDV